MQRVVVISCRRFRTTSRSHLQGSRLIGYPEMSVIYYHYSLRNGQGKRSFHLLRGGSLKSLMCASCFGMYLGHPQVYQYKCLTKGKYNKNLRGPLFYSHYFYYVINIKLFSRNTNKMQLCNRIYYSKVF